MVYLRSHKLWGKAHTHTYAHTHTHTIWSPDLCFCQYMMSALKILDSSFNVIIKLKSSRGLFGEGDGTPLQYSCLENPMDGGAWWAAVHGVAESRTRLSVFTFTFHFPALEKEMATHSSVLAWRIPGTGEPGGLPSLRSHRFRHDWSA